VASSKHTHIKINVLNKVILIALVMHCFIHVLLHSKAAHNIRTQRKQRRTVYSRLSIVPKKKKNTQYAAFGIVAWGASLNCLRWVGSWEAGG
jgi:hypothetical protein